MKSRQKGKHYYNHYHYHTEAPHPARPRPRDPKPGRLQEGERLPGGGEQSLKDQVHQHQSRAGSLMRSGAQSSPSSQSSHQPIDRELDKRSCRSLLVSTFQRDNAGGPTHATEDNNLRQFPIKQQTTNESTQQTKQRDNNKMNRRNESDLGGPLSLVSLISNNYHCTSTIDTCVRGSLDQQHKPPADTRDQVPSSKNSNPISGGDKSLGYDTTRLIERINNRIRKSESQTRSVSVCVQKSPLLWQQMSMWAPRKQLILVTLSCVILTGLLATCTLEPEATNNSNTKRQDTSAPTTTLVNDFKEQGNESKSTASRALNGPPDGGAQTVAGEQNRRQQAAVARSQWMPMGSTSSPSPSPVLARPAGDWSQATSRARPLASTTESILEPEFTNGAGSHPNPMSSASWRSVRRQHSSLDNTATTNSSIKSHRQEANLLATNQLKHDNNNNNNKSTTIGRDSEETLIAQQATRASDNKSLIQQSHSSRNWAGSDASNATTTLTIHGTISNNQQRAGNQSMDPMIHLAANQNNNLQDHLNIRASNPSSQQTTTTTTNTIKLATVANANGGSGESREHQHAGMSGGGSNADGNQKQLNNKQLSVNRVPILKLSSFNGVPSMNLPTVAVQSDNQHKQQQSTSLNNNNGAYVMRKKNKLAPWLQGAAESPKSFSNANANGIEKANQVSEKEWPSLAVNNRGGANYQHHHHHHQSGVITSSPAKLDLAATMQRLTPNYSIANYQPTTMRHMINETSSHSLTNIGAKRAKAEARNSEQISTLNQLWQNVLGDALGQLISLSLTNENPPASQPAQHHQQQQAPRSHHNIDRKHSTGATTDQQFQLFDDNSGADSEPSIDFPTSSSSDARLGSPRPMSARHFQSGSNSAPSVSLPPLSHLFVPRNPFKLFASASASHPLTTPTGRFRPGLLLQAASSQRNKQMSNNQAHQQTGAMNQHQQQSDSDPQLVLIGNHHPSAKSMMNNNNNNNHNPHHNDQNTYIMNNHVAASESAPPISDHSSSSSLFSSSSSGRPILYAHSGSVEQLERLLKAASQATGQMPTILPAIVSAPNGPIAGFYIPAIEPYESGGAGSPGSSSSSSSSSVTSTISKPGQLMGAESGLVPGTRGGGYPGGGSTANSIMSMELNMPSASQLNQLASSLAISKIPGTDYILHPDEVRAMINIGELAWQKQLASSSPTSSSSLDSSSSNDSNENNNNGNNYKQHANSHANSQNNQQQSSSTSNINQYANKNRDQDDQQHHKPRHGDEMRHQNYAGLMQENHAENARDFAYIEQAQHDFARRRPSSSSNVNGNGIGNNHDYINNNGDRDQVSPQSTENHHHKSGAGADQPTNRMHSLMESPSPASTRPVNLIRLNRHHFMPWTTASASNSQQQATSSSNNNDNIVNPNNNNNNQAQVMITAKPETELHGHRLLELAAASPMLRTRPIQLRHPINGANQPFNPAESRPIGFSSTSSDPGHLRLSTQLTPQEIKLVEDSIFEALLVAQHSIPRKQRVLAPDHLLSSGAAANRPTVLAFRATGLHPLPVPLSMSASRPQFHWSASSPINDEMSNNGNQNKRPLSWLESLKTLRRRQSARPPITHHAAAAAASVSPLGLHLMTAGSILPTSGIMSIVPLINVSSFQVPDIQQDSMPPQTIHIASNSMDNLIRDRESRPYPSPLLADQDTNKQPSSSNVLDDNHISMLASETMSAPQTIMFANAHHDPSTTADSFGSRLVSPPAARQPTGGLHRPAVTSHSSGSAREQQALSQHQSYKLLIGTPQDPRHQNRNNNHRINVDWPPMTSDADYYPSSESTIRNWANQLQPQQTNASAHSLPASSRNSQSPKTLAVTAGSQSSIGSSSANRSNHAPPGLDLLNEEPSTVSRHANNQLSQRLHQRIRPIATRGRPTSSSSLALTQSSAPKLQFAPDYQAREGVPIYNNNVSISGSLLDRQRSTE